MEDILVPIFICVVLPVTVVWLVARTRQNEANKKAEIMLKAIEAGVPVDMEQFNTEKKKTPKTIKQGLLDKLSGACITSLIGIAFIVLFLVNQYGPGVDFFFDNMFPIAGFILLAVGIGLPLWQTSLQPAHQEEGYTVAYCNRPDIADQYWANMADELLMNS